MLPCDQFLRIAQLEAVRQDFSGSVIWLKRGKPDLIWAATG
jgi:hypothetical protein